MVKRAELAYLKVERIRGLEKLPAWIFDSDRRERIFVSEAYFCKADGRL